MRAFILLIPILALIGCVSDGAVRRDLSATEAGSLAASENPDDRDISQVDTWWEDDEDSFFHEDENTEMEMRANAHAHSEPGWSSGDDWHDGWLWIGRTAPDQTRWSNYHTDWGWELGVAGLNPESAVMASLYFSPVRFTTEDTQSFEDPWLIGWQITLNGRKPFRENLSGSLGIGISNGLILWDYANPLTDGDETIHGDSLGFFSLVMPISLQSHYGPVMTELVVTPTVRLAGERTGAGFYNDVSQVHAGAPIALRLGIVF